MACQWKLLKYFQNLNTHSVAVAAEKDVLSF